MVYVKWLYLTCIHHDYIVVDIHQSGCLIKFIILTYAPQKIVEEASKNFGHNMVKTWTSYTGVGL